VAPTIIREKSPRGRKSRWRSLKGLPSRHYFRSGRESSNDACKWSKGERRRRFTTVTSKHRKKSKKIHQRLDEQGHEGKVEKTTYKIVTRRKKETAGAPSSKMEKNWSAGLPTIFIQKSDPPRKKIGPGYRGRRSRGYYKGGGFRSARNPKT